MNVIWDPELSLATTLWLLVPPALAVVTLAVLALVRGHVAGRDRRDLIVRTVRRLLVLALLAVAAAGPSYGTRTTTVVVTDVDVFFVVDTTTSSNGEDVAGGRTRLDLMKDDILELMGQYAGSRFSVMSFDSATVTRLPLVRDPIAVRSALARLDVEITAYSGGSSIGEAAEPLAQRLAESFEDHPERARLVFFLSDGEQTASGAPESYAAAGQYVDDGAVLGYGTVAGGRMRENLDVTYTSYDDGFTDDPAVDEVEAEYVKDTTLPGSPDAISRIDEGNLRTVANQLGVGYEHRTTLSGPTAPDVDRLLGDEVVVEEAQVAVRYYWIPAIAALLLLLAEVALPLRQLLELRAARRGRQA